MPYKTLLASVMLLAAGSVWAESSLLGDIAKQAAKDSAQVIAPDAVKKVEQANQALETAKSLKENVQTAPDMLKKQALEAVEQKIEEATPEQTKKTVETVKNLKEKVENAPQTGEALKAKAKEKAAEKVLELLR